MKIGPVEVLVAAALALGFAPQGGFAEEAPVPAAASASATAPTDALAAGSTAASGSTAQSESSTAVRAKPGVKLETILVGEVITLAPDGSVHATEVGGELPQDVLEKLPPEVREQIQKSRRTDKAARRHAMTIVVDVDGKHQEFHIDGNNADSLKAITEQGDKLPAEMKRSLQAACDAIKKAREENEARAQKIRAEMDRVKAGREANESMAQKMRAEHEAMAQKMRAEMERIRANAGRTAQSGEGNPAREVNSKLDEILKRLDRMEKELASLRGEGAKEAAK